MIKGIAGAMGGGVVGAALWAAITSCTNYEIGFIACAVGALVGVGMMLGARDVQSSMCGVVAAVIAVASIVGAKFAVVQIVVNQQEVKLQSNFVVTEDLTKMFVADQLVEEYEKSGKTLTWPDGRTVHSAEDPSHYPKDLWQDLEARWTLLHDDQKRVYEEATEVKFKTLLKDASATTRDEIFKGSFTFWDVLWFFLAVGSAYKIGSGQGGT